MLLTDEKGMNINADGLKEDLLRSIDETPDVSQEELENDLSGYYQAALTQDMRLNGADETGLRNLNMAAAVAIWPFGKNILSRIRKFICKVLNGSSTTGDIIDAVLDAIASIIPGGIVIKAIIRKIVKYVLNQGVNAFCQIA
ncbi:hypothetical protein ACTHGU_11385 [Chitinophagaceae bacterium MMS25-I14]